MSDFPLPKGILNDLDGISFVGKLDKGTMVSGLSFVVSTMTQIDSIFTEEWSTYYKVDIQYVPMGVKVVLWKK